METLWVRRRAAFAFRKSLTVSGKVVSLVVTNSSIQWISSFFLRGEIVRNGSGVGEVHLLVSNWNALTHGAVSTRQDKTHFKLISEAKCSLIPAWWGDRDLLPLCANYIIPRIAGLRATEERGLLSEDKTQPSRLCDQHKARKPVSEAMSMNPLLFSKICPESLLLWKNSAVQEITKREK